MALDRVTLLLLAMVAFSLLSVPLAHFTFSVHDFILSMHLALALQQLAITRFAFPLASDVRLRGGMWHRLGDTRQRVAASKGLLCLLAVSRGLLVWWRRAVGDVC